MNLHYLKLSIECKDGFYNVNCTERCGHCTNSEVCDKQNGSCVNGCSQNFQMPLCQGIFQLSNFLVINNFVFHPNNALNQNYEGTFYLSNKTMFF